ncbi:CBS domain-containing protein [Vulcanisaeta distributa]|uniref:Putative signal transduction protein with CBS domains n=1 Tax=Vulcanisaeta distributa (strain DSM 14429 / JCM 11212 / NBRC 100878 / IC-017) TaxID=572478 RepID=E1QQT9_VULDI|nr:CBS domain-containing protein [Vulcanisaeta distributa]ADN51701.1 putative signal transduction protein with CBS domains [Vulcanisaeta distributa DSM 14429]
MNAQELMTGSVFTIDPNRELAVAVQLMVDHGFRHLPIIEGGSVRSVLTALDVINGIVNDGINALREPVVKYGSGKFLTVLHGDDAMAVIRKMLDNGIDHALVLKGNELAGIITERDIVNKMPEQVFVKYRVHEVANRDPIRVSEDASLASAMEVMVRHGIRHLLIADQDRLLGIMTVKDVLRYAIKYYKLRGQVDLSIAVSKLMSHNPVTIDSAASLIDAVRLMRRNNIGSLPIVEAGRLMGIITEHDVVKSIIK